MTSAIALNDCLQWGAVTAIIIIVAFSIISNPFQTTSEIRFNKLRMRRLFRL